ncbi:hypothetical protein EA242_26155 [Escherichia coli]|nr:hypothetical protein EA242_26155 [Escherichia coli]
MGSAPLTSITESDAQISGGETRQDYKDTRRFPLVAPSCALLFLPFGLPVSFRCYGTIKIPGVSPWWLPRALSCSCLSVYRCHSAVMAAFVSFHA